VSRKVTQRAVGTQNGTCERCLEGVHWTVMSDYAARIRAARAFAGLKQEQLAERLGVDTNTIKRREAGTQNPKRGELLAIAAITGVPVSFMEHGFGETDESEVLERLDRIEAALLAGVGDLEQPRDYARAVVSELRAAEGGDGAREPTQGQDRGPRPVGQPKPPARSRRRS
jgi:transcriptional regulator with XRE-family HTH domain